MDLQSFVASVLVQIVKGATDAQEQLKHTGARVNPSLERAPHSDHSFSVSAGLYKRAAAPVVQFDVAVTATDGTTAEGGAGLRVWGARLGADGKITSENSTVSRVQFAIAIALPVASAPSE